MKLYAFLETRNLQRWEFFQQGLFPAPEAFQGVAIKWHQPFQFEDERVTRLFFGDPSILTVRTLPPDMSTDLRSIRIHHNVFDEGYILASDLMVVRQDDYKLRIPVPGENSFFWRDLSLFYWYAASC